MVAVMKQGLAKMGACAHGTGDTVKSFSSLDLLCIIGLLFSVDSCFSDGSIAVE